MRKYITFFLHGIIVMLLGCNVFAEECKVLAKNCEDTGRNITKIYFGNGVGNTLANARSSQNAMVHAYWIKHDIRQDYPDEEFIPALAYNPTRGFVKDIIEVFNQKVEKTGGMTAVELLNLVQLAKKGAVIATKQLSTGSGAGRIIFKLALDALDDASDAYIESLKEDAEGLARYYQEEVESDHCNMYLNDLDSGNRVIIVAHSQGNLFANKAVAEVVEKDYNRFSSSIGIVGVANPAGLLVYKNEYVTAHDDLVIDSLRVTHSVLPSNIENDPSPYFWEDHRDYLNHTFTKSYLASELEYDYATGEDTLPSRGVIDEMFLDVVSTLVHPPKKNPVVDSVFPTKAELNQPTTFTVTGQELPENLEFFLEDCPNVVPGWGGTEAERRFTCIPNGTAGLKSLEINDECGFLYGGYINIVDDEPEEPEPQPCPYGTGLYCGKSSLNQNPSYLYYCQNGNYEEREQCSNGCQVMDPNVDDKCKDVPTSCPYGTGYYCGKSSLGQKTNSLYYCQNGNYEEREQCSNGCQVMDPNVDDKCKDSDDGQDTIDAPGDSTADITGSDGSVITTCTFQDVDQTAFYADEVNAFCSAGILIGYSIDGERLFKPANDANQVEALKVLFYAYDYTNVSVHPNTDPWYNYYLDKAQEYNINVTESVAGEPALRKEVMDYIVKIFYNQTVADPVQFLVDEGITNGSAPDEPIRRYELVLLAYRAAEKTGTIANIKFGVVDEPPLPIPVTSTLGNVIVDRAMPEIGHTRSVLENGKYIWADSNYTYCARFVRVMFGKPAQWGSAVAMCNAFQSKIQTSGTPSAGDVICYGADSSNWGYGHVAIAKGDGTEIGVLTRSTGVGQRSILSSASYYQGFIKAEDYDAYY